MPRISAPTISAESMPPRLSTGSVASFTWLGTNFRAMTSATTASGSVTRNTEPHQKYSRSAPAISGPRAEMPPPIADQSRDRLGPRLPGPECGDERERGGEGHAGREPAEDAGDREHAVGGCVRGEQARGDRQQHAADQHHLAAVPVAERAEVEHRRREAERVAHRDQVERGLRRVERLADVGQRDVGDREVQVGDRGDEDQREEDELRVRRRAVGLAPPVPLARWPRRRTLPGSPGPIRDADSVTLVHPIQGDAGSEQRRYLAETERGVGGITLEVIV